MVCLTLRTGGRSDISGEHSTESQRVAVVHDKASLARSVVGVTRSIFIVIEILLITTLELYAVRYYERVIQRIVLVRSFAMARRARRGILISVHI